MRTLSPLVYSLVFLAVVQTLAYFHLQREVERLTARVTELEVCE